MPSCASLVRVVLINRPIADVFAFADAENDPQRRSGVQEIKRQGELGVRTRYLQRVGGPAGRAITADIEVTAFEPNSQVAFKGIARPVPPHGDYELKFGCPAPMWPARRPLRPALASLRPMMVRFLPLAWYLVWMASRVATVEASQMWESDRSRRARGVMTPEFPHRIHERVF